MSGQPVPIGFEMTDSAVGPDPNQGARQSAQGGAPAPIGFESHMTQPAGNDHTKVPVEQVVTVEGVKIEEKDQDKTLFFDDYRRRIDYVLAFERNEKDAGGRVSSGESTKVVSNSTKDADLRKLFEDELVSQGLDIERDEAEKIGYVKIHAPWEVLVRRAEILNMKMPLSDNDTELDTDSLLSCCPTPFDLDEDILNGHPVSNYFTAKFDRDLLDEFPVGEGKHFTKENFFTEAQRSLIVDDIVSRIKLDVHNIDTKKNMTPSFKKLVSMGVYSAAYPLHAGPYTSEHSIITEKANYRRFLYHIWGRAGTWHKYQPLDQIREYFGEKIGIYFAWLGYYTMMLIPASIVGLIAFIYGCATIFDDVPGNELCDPAQSGSTVMCPLCDKRCSYWSLSESCAYTRVTHLFDNPATVAFAIFMALWASFFHEIWKRKEATIQYDWDVAGFEQEEETVRAEFESKVQKKRPNPVTKIVEPYLPSWSKCLRYCTTFSIILMFLCLVLAAVFGVIIYRIAIAAVAAASDVYYIKARPSLLASGTAACINLVIIFILNKIYQKIALALTELESHRTETEWEDAYTFKMFLFQAVNFYSSIVYIAFFKGRFVGRPGDYDYTLFGYRQEECDPAGCLMELCLQMGIIMIGKQAFSNFKEVILPKLTVWYKTKQAQTDKKTQWEMDYTLVEIPRLGLFEEYLEMVIQYGFVTIFVAAFPLAPLFALINNLIEIRLDAYKFVTQWRRPLALRAQDIGIWFGILQGISAVAVVTNAVIIAFTSEFIPRMVYQYVYSENQSLSGYYNFSLSTFSTKDFQSKSVPDDPKVNEFGNVTECRYRDFRDGNYEYTIAFWHVLAARLAFIVVFENTIVFLTWLVMYLVPDVPHNVKILMLREKFLAKESLIKADSNRN